MYKIAKKTEETAQVSIISFNRQTESKFNIQDVYGELETSSKTCTSQFLQNPNFQLLDTYTRVSGHCSNLTQIGTTHSLAPVHHLGMPGFWN